MPRPAEVATAITDEAVAVQQAMDGMTDSDRISDMAGAVHEKLDMALAVLERATDDVSRERARIHFVRGGLLFSLARAALYGKGHAKKTFRLALENYQKACDERDGPSPRARYRMGMCYSELGDKQAALVALGAAAAEAEMLEDHQLVVEAQKLAEELRAGKKSGGGCYIATACYGSYDHPDVMVLRRFRDERLMASPMGRALVRIYYVLSPTLADRLEGTWMSTVVRRCVAEPLVRRLR